MTRDARISAAICIAVGFAVAAGVHFHPEGLKAPAWIVHAASGAFVLAGLVILAADLRAHRMHRVLIVALLAAMFAPPAWVAFGAGERACTVGGNLFGMAASGLMCRIPFGLGAMLVAFMLLVAWRSKPAKHGE